MTPTTTIALLRQFDAAVDRTVRPAAAVLGLLYVMFAAAHPFFLQHRRLEFSLLAAVSALTLFALAATHTPQHRVLRTGHGAVGVITFVALVNSVAMLAETGDPIQTTNFLFVEIGLASVVLNRRWFAGLTAAVLVSWSGAWLLFAGPGPWSHFVFAMVTGTALASIIFVFRLRNYRTLLDVTERARIEHELREKQRELATLISNLPGIAYRCRNDADWTMEFMSEGTLETTGYAPHEIVHNRTRSYADLIEPADREAVWNQVQAALAARDSFRLVYRIRHRDGRPRWVWEQGRGVYGRGGKLLALEGFITDITERVAAEEREREASRLKSAILANMSHEIRTPMTAIIGFADLLVRRLKGTQWQRDAETIASGGRRLLHLLNNVLDLARIEAGKADLARKPHPLREPVERAVGLLRVLAEKKALQLTTEYADGLLILGDPHAEEQVWTNIIGNAIKFTDQGGVAVRSYRAGAAAVVEIADTGVGIGESFLPHLFEEFRQESEGISRSFEGSGLGLTISKRLVNALGGEIRVQSVKGKGTTVRVELPLAVGPAAAAPEPQPAAVPEPVRRRTVLLVEDDENTARLVAAFLAPAHEVIWRNNGAAAEQVLREQPIDLVLLDINLKSPVEDGIAVMRRLRAALGASAPPMAALTAYAMSGDEERFRAAGFDGYLAKPFDMGSLMELIEEQSQPH